MPHILQMTRDFILGHLFHHIRVPLLIDVPLLDNEWIEMEKKHSTIRLQKVPIWIVLIHTH